MVSYILCIKFQRPPSRSRSASPRYDLSPAPSLTDNQSDSVASRVSFDMTPSDDEGMVWGCMRMSLYLFLTFYYRDVSNTSRLVIQANQNII